jgi:peptidyl-prolyl cis-trans isomerase B (cyclophilin B)
MKDIIIKIISVVAIVCFVVLIMFVIPKTTSTTKQMETTTTSMDKEKEFMNGKHHVEIKVKDLGVIKLELDADVAPITVTNFLNLVDNKFYDGLTFHRIIDGFMIQGGDPLGNGTGGSDEKITGEFESNGIKNDISHVRGVISMARGTDKNSASSQFFIVQKDSTYLDGQYAGFGHVTNGIEVVDKVVNSVKGKVGSNGSVEKENQPIIESIVQID